METTMTTTIDTLSYVKKLEAAGVDRKTAEAHAEAINTTVVPLLATKADLDRAVERLDTRITGLASELRQEMLKQSLGLLFGVLTIGGFLIRFIK
jgi:hypothetical protein